MRCPLHPCFIIRDAKPETALAVCHGGTVATTARQLTGCVGYMVQPNNRTRLNPAVAT
jgi:hypothetical protein